MPGPNTLPAGVRPLPPSAEQRIAAVFEDGLLATAKAVAALIRVDVKTLRAMTDEGVIRAVRRGKRRAYTEADVRAYLATPAEAEQAVSVYKPQNSPYFHYDFVRKGRRFHGSTGVETRRKAEEVERKVRTEAALGILDHGEPMTLDEASGRWWTEVGQHKASARILFYRLGIVVRLLGPSTRLCDLSTLTTSIAIERRRGETYTRGGIRVAEPRGRRWKPLPAKTRTLANATVNSDIVKRLRAITNRARKVWQVQGLQEIDWSRLLLQEPEPEIIHFSDPYQQAWVDACGPTERFALLLLLRYGVRFGELFFPPAAFLPSTPKGPGLALNKRKKGSMFLPLTDTDARMIAARVGRAEAAGLDSIWIEQDEAGELVTVSKAAMQSRLRAAADRAGVDHRRLIHSIRHHVGTDVLNETGDLRLVQRMLGHADIKSTLVYAHVLDEGLRDVINSRNSPEAIEPEDGFIVQKQPRRRR